MRPGIEVDSIFSKVWLIDRCVAMNDYFVERFITVGKALSNPEKVTRTLMGKWRSRPGTRMCEEVVSGLMPGWHGSKESELRRGDALH